MLRERLLGALRPLARRRYQIVFLVAALLALWLFYELMLSSLAYKDLYLYADMNGVQYTLVSLALSVVLAALLGWYSALVVRQVDERALRARDGAGLGGTILSLFATGCPTCGTFLFGLLGYPLALFSLPFWGLELKLLSIVLLSGAVLAMGSASCTDCEAPMAARALRPAVAAQRG